MHVFCDESGGTGRDDSLFLVAAVALTAGEATRIMKSFRKATGLRGEVKGSRLTLDQRSLFFDLVKRSGTPAISVAYCSGMLPLGNWALGAVKDADLWAELVIESTLHLGTPSAMSLYADRRYHGAQARSLQECIGASITNQTRSNSFPVHFVDSRDHDGVQIADVVANTAYREILHRETVEAFTDLRQHRRLAVEPIQLKARRPYWLEPALA